MEFLAPLHVLAVVVAAFLIMFNINAGKRLLVGTLVLLVLVPIALGLLNTLLSDFGQVVGDVRGPNGAGVLVGVLLLVLVLVAFIRFLLRRRRLQGLLGRPQTSLKRRVDRS